VVASQTKSGSNAFTDLLLDIGHSDATQARDPFSQATRDPITNRFSFRRRVYGQFGIVGGRSRRIGWFSSEDYQGPLELGSILPAITYLLTSFAPPCGAPHLVCNLSEYLDPNLGGGLTNVIYDPTSGNPDGTVEPYSQETLFPR